MLLLLALNETSLLFLNPDDQSSHSQVVLVTLQLARYCNARAVTHRPPLLTNENTELTASNIFYADLFDSTWEASLLLALPRRRSRSGLGDISGSRKLALLTSFRNELVYRKQFKASFLPTEGNPFQRQQWFKLAAMLSSSVRAFAVILRVMG